MLQDLLNCGSCSFDLIPHELFLFKDDVQDGLSSLVLEKDIEEGEEHAYGDGDGSHDPRDQ